MDVSDHGGVAQARLDGSAKMVKMYRQIPREDGIARTNETAVPHVSDAEALSPARQGAILAALAFTSVVCVGLFALRVFLTHDTVTYRWLIWNLFLAWLPMLGALVAYNLAQTRAWGAWLLVAPCALFWLLFLPNAPYLITDLVHLRPQDALLFWYDLAMIVSGVLSGVLLGAVSLLLMQSLVTHALGRFVGWCFALGAIGLSSFGVYLGRFGGWNSWDIFFAPRAVLQDVYDHLWHPLAHVREIGFSLLFAVLFLAVYFVIAALAQPSWQNLPPALSKQPPQIPR